MNCYAYIMLFFAVVEIPCFHNKCVCVVGGAECAMYMCPVYMYNNIIIYYVVVSCPDPTSRKEKGLVNLDLFLGLAGSEGTRQHTQLC